MNYNILGMCVLCNNKNQVLVYHGRKVHIIDIHPRKNMRYISSIDMPQNQRFINLPNLIRIDRQIIALQSISDTVTADLMLVNLGTGQHSVWSQNFGEKVYGISQRKYQQIKSPCDFITWATQKMSIKIFSVADIARTLAQ